MNMSGVCYLVGAGPGDPGLITRRGFDLLCRADVVIYDYLANPALLASVRGDAELIYVGKKSGHHTLPQEEINRLIVEKTSSGNKVVRLKGGDPFIFGRGGEECEALEAAGCRFEVVPGVTAAVGASAWAGIPLTQRGLASAVAFVTGHEDPNKLGGSLDWKSLASFPGTLVIYMGMVRLGVVMDRLMECGLPPSRPVAVVRWAATPQQQTVRATVATLAAIVEEKKLGPPSVILIGEVALLEDKCGWREKLPLHGTSFLLTRMRSQSSRLREWLEEEGAEVLELPMIRIEPVKTNPLPQLTMLYAAASPEKIDLRGTFDSIVFTSRNAVEWFFHFYLELADIRTLAGISLVAVGKTTAGALRERGLRVDFVPCVQTGEGLAGEWPIPAGARILFPCGNLASGEEHLQKRGAQVTRLEIYSTVPETEDRAGVRQRLSQGGVDWILFASSSAVENFHALGLKHSPTRYASIGPSTSATLRKLGYEVAYQADAPDPEIFVKGLRDFILKEKGSAKP